MHLTPPIALINHFDPESKYNPEASAAAAIKPFCASRSYHISDSEIGMRICNSKLQTYVSCTYVSKISFNDFINLFDANKEVSATRSFICIEPTLKATARIETCTMSGLLSGGTEYDSGFCNLTLMNERRQASAPNEAES